MDIQNLNRLATQLESKKQKDFDILTYRNDQAHLYNDFDYLHIVNSTICGAVSCAIGGFVEIEPMVVGDWGYLEGEWSYEKYSERVFGFEAGSIEW